MRESRKADAFAQEAWGTMGFFWKIMIGFLIGFTLSIAGLIFISAATGASAVIPLWNDVSGNALTLFGDTAIARYEQGGENEANAYLARIEAGSRLRGYLFNAEGGQIAGSAKGREAQAMAQAALETGYEGNFFQLRGARRLVSSHGKRYVMVAEARENFWSNPAVVMLRGLIFFGALGGISFLLARNIALPVLQLRGAAHRMAEGELSIRVGDSMGRRRDELGVLARDFDRMAERIESLLAAQKRLLGDISHELRSPLARLRVALELARQRTGAEARTSLDRIEREGERLNALIEQLLTLTRLETDSGAAQEKEALALEALVREVAENVDFEAQSHHRRVEMIRSEPCAMWGNRELLMSAAENVIRNASRYTKEGTSVEVSVTREGDMAVVMVRDHGEGAPPEALKELFRPFYRVGTDRARASGGTGLGLAITERAVRLHGGTAVAENAPDGGLCVTLKLPLSLERDRA